MANSTMRQTFCRFFSIFCLLSLPTSAHAQEPTAATALRDIQNAYNFDPSKLSFEEQAKRAPTLSALWDRYDKTSDVYRDALRTALKTQVLVSYFTATAICNYSPSLSSRRI